MSDTVNWLYEIKPKLLTFLGELKGRKSGFFKYSLSGDIYGEDIKWGLGNSVFAAKIYHMLDEMVSLNPNYIKEWVDFILSFQNEKGEIYDPLIQRKSLFNRVYKGLLFGNHRNIFNGQTRRAESRQAFSALISLGAKPKYPYKNIPDTRERVEKYIMSLDWKKPWSAASHFSHLLFFLKYNNEFFSNHKSYTEELIQHTFTVLERFYSEEDGLWYHNKFRVSVQQKINGAMKVLSGMDAVDKISIDQPEKLIDFCLINKNDSHACDNFNIICVLYHCSRITDYKKAEIREFCLKKLEEYRNYYWPEIGGFSFHPKQASEFYYGVKVSKGLPEPDIHATHLFVWGIVLIGEILGIDTELKFKKPIT